MKRLIDLRNKFPGKKALVLGNGTSIRDYRTVPDTVTFGVNDINKLITPDIHVVVDRVQKFSLQRREDIQKTEASCCISQDGNKWAFPPEKHHMYKLGKFRSFDNFDNIDVVDYGLDSPYMCALIAYKLGFRTIAMIGVDFNNGHFYNEADGVHQLVKANKIDDVVNIYANLYMKFKPLGIGIFNLSMDSKVISLPKVTWEQFENM